MNTTESPTSNPTETMTTQTPTISPTPLQTTLSPSLSPTQSYIDAIRFPDYTKPKSFDSVFIIIPILLVFLTIMVCCQRKIKRHDGDSV